MFLEGDILGEGAEEDMRLCDALDQERASIACKELMGAGPGDDGKLAWLEGSGVGRQGGGALVLGGVHLMGGGSCCLDGGQLFLEGSGIGGEGGGGGVG